TTRRRMLRGMQRKLVLGGARAADAVHVPSSAMGDLLQAQGVDTPLRVNPYGVRAGLDRNGEESSNEGVPRFLYVMNYTLQKNLGCLLRALARAKDEDLPVRVVLTSSMERGPAACFREDRAIVEDNDLVGSGYLELAGRQSGEELARLYRSVDACVFPSITEAFGNPLVEAMALGLPLLCADRPYAREICGHHAIYFDPLDPASLVALWRDWPVGKNGWTQADPADLSERFSWDRHVARLVEDLLGETGT
ncbi:MAG: glycosyltransferase, partial [Planctomycetota bacterium]